MAQHITQAVILAGGQGTRLRPYTLTVPKPMIEINKKPFLEYLITDLKKSGITEVIVLVGYLHQKIESYFGDGKSFGISIRYSYSEVTTETGKRLYNALPLLKKKFLLLYGDNIWPLNLSAICKRYIISKKKALMTVYNNRDNRTKNNVFVEENLVKHYSPKRDNGDANGVNIGYFIFDKHILNNIPEGNFSLDVILANLISKNQLAAFKTDHPYYSLTSPDRLHLIETYLKDKKVVFLDRDGVINKKAPKAEYITSWEKFTFIPHVKEALRLLQKKEYAIYIITNQSGIARSMITRKKLDSIHQRLINELKKINVEIKDIYVCPHGWDEACWCRKPSPGMLFQAASEHAIDLYKTIFIGDDIRDKEAGDAAGVLTYLVSPNEDLLTIVKKYL